MIRFAAIAVAVLLLAAGSWLFVSKHQRSHINLPAAQQPGNWSAEFRAAGLMQQPQQGAGANDLHKTASAAPAKAVAGTPGPANTNAPRASALPRKAPPRKRTWDPDFLSNLRKASVGDPIRFELVGGEMASGRIGRLQLSGAEVVYVSGQLLDPESGRFFFQKQTAPGVAGAFVGVVEFPASRKAYRIEPSGPGGTSELVERPLGSVVCLELPQPNHTPAIKVEEIPPLNPEEFPTLPIPDYQNGIVPLQSQAGSIPVIYLDFQGGYTATWGGIAYDRPLFDNTQIREVWERVAEDYMPFNINVVTDLKAFQSAPEGSRQRVIITPTDAAFPGAGGVAYVGSFDWTGDTPCWVFVTNAAHYCAQACSHEAGHGLGLIHDGQQIDGTHVEYYYGHGIGDTSWAPIMGVAYYKNVSQWSKGEYVDANNPEDQLAIIASQNNVHVRPDDTGDTLATSRYLEIYDDFSAGAQGVIEKTADTDAFQFTTSGGDVSLRADPVSIGPNLAIQVTLYDALDTLLASNNPQATLWASITTNLPAGIYTFRVTGAGRNDPTTNGFSSYDSLGYYSITGLVTNARLPSRFSIPEHSADGTLVGSVPANTPSADSLAYSIVAGNTGDTFSIDNSGNLSVADNGLLDYNALAQNSQFPVQFEMFVSITDLSNSLLDETNRRVVVAITQVRQSPTFSGLVVSNTLYASTGTAPQFAASVLEHSPPGTTVATLMGSDTYPYALLSYSIVAGNSNGMFAIGSQSGVITVAGDPVVAIQNLYQLTIAVSDQIPLNPLMATSTVTITVKLPYAVGSISHAVYTNLNGTLVSALTNATSFPTDPAFEEQITSFEAGTTEDQGLGAAIRGYLLPPATGNYTFWIGSQDNGELWLSSSTNPVSMTRVADISGDGKWTAPGEWTKYPSQQSAPVWLAVGNACYIEARVKAGTGSNYLGVAWECASNGIAQQVIPGQYLAPYFMHYVPHPIGFTVNLYRDAIAGTQVGTVRVANVNGSGATTLALISGNEDGLFSFDPATGVIRLVNDTALLTTTRTNYSLQVEATDAGTPPLSGVAVVKINVVPAGAIATGSIMAEIWTNIVGTNVLDLTSNGRYPKRPDLLSPLTAFETGTSSLIYFTNTGPFVFTNGSASNGSAAGTNSTVFANNGSSSPEQSVAFLSPAYGLRIRALLTPTNSGSYTFFISSANDSQLMFSASTNPAEAAVIAYVAGGVADYKEWTRDSSQQSAPIWLVAGNHYYIETLQKYQDGVSSLSATNPGALPVSWAGAGHVEVGWTGPGLPGTNVIDGAFLSPVDIEYPPELAGQSVKLPRATTIGSVVATLTAIDSPLDTVAYEIVSGNLSNTFALHPSNGQLSITDNLAFASGAITNFTLVVRAQDSGYGGLYPPSSTLATITLPVVDNSRSLVSWSGAGTDDHWSSPRNWNGDVPNDKSALTFAGLKQRTNYNDLLASVGPITLNGSGFSIEGNPLVLLGGLVSFGTNTWAIDSTLGAPQSFNASGGPLVVAGSIANNGNLLTLDVSSSMNLAGVVSGSGGLSMALFGTLTMGALNTYTGPTSISFGTLSLTNSGALAASSSINVNWGATLNVSGTAGTYVIPTGQTLTGYGKVIGPIVINGTLSPFLPKGPFPDGRNMTFINKVVLAGNTAMLVGQSSSYTTTITVSGELNYGGTLTAFVNGGNVLGSGQTFKLFSATHYTGSFTNFSLPSLPFGYVWDTSHLTNDGTIRTTQPAAIPVTILPLIPTTGGLAIRFPTIAGRTYILESCPYLQPVPHWNTAFTRTGTGGIISITVAEPPQAVPERFFRVKAY